MLRRIIPTAERTVTRGGNKTIDKGDAIRERLSGYTPIFCFPASCLEADLLGDRELND
jgi:hypothetical protein